MADTTGPMPLIRWRDEGKRRLGLSFTSFWTKRAAWSRSPREGVVMASLRRSVCIWAWGARAARVHPWAGVHLGGCWAGAGQVLGRCRACVDLGGTMALRAI